ncbi:MAG: CopD family protein [Verrucomicrobiota bacterium]|nr:CopD family protein [Verrucomicrobiota bacterium]
MNLYGILIALHVLGACIWTGGHLTLASAVLPRALRERRAQLVIDFERGYERIGLPALFAQVITGLWLAHVRLGRPADWFAANPLAHVVQVKLALLAATVLLALHARLRLIPRLRDDNLPLLAVHIVAVTTLAVLFVLAGVLFRVGGI